MTKTHRQPLPPPVARVLALFHGLKRLYRLLAILGWAGVLYLALALAAMHADRFLFLGPDGRVLLVRGVQVVAGLFLAGGLLRFALRRPSWRRVAYDLQDRLPDGGAERYVTLDSVLRETDGDTPLRRELLDQLAEATAAHSAGLRPLRLARDPGLVRAIAWLTGLVLLYGLLVLAPGYQFPLMVSRFAHPRANLPKPSFVTLTATPRDIVVGRGGEVVIQVESRGRIPPGLGWLCRLAGAVPDRCVIARAPGLGAEVALDPDAAEDLNRVQRNLFLFSQSDLRDSFSYRLRGGDAETEVRVVEVVAQPRITALSLKITPPAYTRLPAEEVADPRQPVRVFEGSAVELVFAVDQPVSNRWILAGRREIPVREWDEAGRTGRYAFTMGDKIELEVRVVNARGFANTERARVSLVRLEDQSPTVRLEFPTGDLAVTPGELVPLQALAEDDLEVASASFRFQLNPELNPDAPFQESVIAVPEPGGPRVSLTENLDLGQTTAGPGDEILLVVRARDSRGNDGESRPVRIKVNSFARGENERRRLDALNVVREGVVLLGGKTPDSAGLEALAKRAAGLGVALEEPVTAEALMRLLEFEQHFTDAPRHKEDARMLAGVLDYALAEGRLPAGPEGPWAEVLTRDVVGPLAASRRLQNAAWRLYGMQVEIADIRRRLQGEASEADAQRKARREALEALVLAAAESAAKAGALQEVARTEIALRKKIAEVKSRAIRPAEGEAPENPFAPLQLDVEAARLSPADEKAVAELNRELKAAGTEYKKLADAAVAAVTESWVASRKGLPLPLEDSELRVVAATVFDRIVRPASGAPAPDAAARRQLAQAVAAERLSSREAGDTGPRQALQRRAELYLKALENVGVDLAAVAEARPGRLDPERLKSLQGELNTAGYYLSRGTGDKGAASCEEIAALLGRLLDLVRPALPALLREAHGARDLLVRLDEALFRELASGRVPKKGTAWARRRVESDLRMLERNPFAPDWAFARDLALMAALDGATAEPLKAALEPAAPLAEALGAERRYWNGLASAWELDDVLGMARLPASEKRLAARLIELEAQWEAGAAAAGDAAVLEKAIQAPEAPEAAATDLAAGLRRLRQANPRATFDGVLKPAMRALLPQAPLETVRAARARLEEGAKALAALEAALSSGGAGVTNAILAATDAMDGAVRLADRARREATLRTGSLDPLGPEAEREDRLVLRLREAVDRYRGRAGESLSVMRETAVREPDAAALGNLGAELTIVKAGLQALQNNLTAAVDQYAAPEQERVYPILEAFRETRGWLRESGADRSGNRAEAAARFLRESPYARWDYLAARAGRLEDALGELEALEKALEPPGADAASAPKRLAAARAGLAGFQDALARVGGDEAVESIRKGAVELAGRVDRLEREKDDRRRLLTVSEALKEGRRLLRRLQGESGQSALERLELAGGPDRMWLQETRLHAEVSRQRLLGQAAWGRRAFTAGLLEALEAAPRPEREAEAGDGSLFCHRMVRSPLSGAVTPPRTEAGGDSIRNPLVKWLLEQADEAAKETQGEDTLRHYRGITREWIMSLKDFLRY